MKDFSLLISVYKGEKAEFLTMCFNSIYQQTMLPTEIVLVEDGPLTPDLYAAIKKEEERFTNIKRVVLKENQGLGIALNKGMQACTYDIIARMDTDDICLPERFKIQVEDRCTWSMDNRIRPRAVKCHCRTRPSRIP